MLYKEFKDAVLSLMNQYTANGVILDNLYNDQSDYVLRIPALYNSGMTDIVTNGKPILEVIDPSEYEIEDTRAGYVVIELPDDFYKARSVLVTEPDGRTYRSHDFHRVGQTTMYINQNIWNRGLFEYERYPRYIPTTPGADIDALVLDGDPDQLMAAQLFVAARLVMQDDAFAYSSFMNEYDERLSNMNNEMTTESTYNTDVYGTSDVYGVIG